MLKVLGKAGPLAFGGMGASGTGGRFGGPASIEQFTQAQWVSIAGVAAQYPF